MVPSSARGAGGGRRLERADASTAEGLIAHDTFRLAAWFLPPLLVGVWLGSRGFRRADPTRFRLWTLRFLMLLAIVMGAQVLSTLFTRPPGAIAMSPG